MTKQLLIAVNSTVCIVLQTEKVHDLEILHTEKYLVSKFATPKKTNKVQMNNFFLIHHQSQQKCINPQRYAYFFRP